MSVRSTFSPAGVLGEIRDTLNTANNLAQSQDAGIGDVNHKLDEIGETLKRTKTGHELHLWGEEVTESE